ncbi:MAG: hypothetical protein JSR39_00540 [Verrucomicrobia bacterium]|nr:hypothetical protein [Verrucomicrobiota bacterium]
MAYFPSISFPSLSGIASTLKAPLGYMPTLSGMASVATSTANYAASFLPQKNTADIQRLTRAVETLKAPDIIDQTIVSERQALKDRKLELEVRYDEICGKFFEDPTSDIHKAWLGFKAEEAKLPSGKTFDPTSTTCTDPDLQATFDAFQEFLALETERQSIVAEIETIGSAVNSDTTLKSEYTDMKREIDAQLHSLSGDYYEDPNCELDKLWKAYRAKADGGAPADEVQAAFDVFLIKDEMRKAFEHLQFMLERLLSSPETTETNIQKTAETKVEKQKQVFEAALQDAQDNKGVDWSSLAVSTLKLGALAGGYILLESGVVL